MMTAAIVSNQPSWLGPVIGAIIGGLLGFGGATVLKLMDYRRQSKGIRLQLIALLKLVATKMLIVKNYAALPNEGFTTLDRLTEQAFSTDTIIAIGAEKARDLYDAVNNAEQAKVAIEYRARDCQMLDELTCALRCSPDDEGEF
jgi:hypothetical protein